MDKNGKSDDRPRYPNVRCLQPGHADEPGYVVCEHVRAGAKVVICSAPTDKDLGVITCGALGHSRQKLSLCCAHCARSNGWAPEKAE